jgi:hypothetical protein
MKIKVVTYPSNPATGLPEASTSEVCVMRNAKDSIELALKNVSSGPYTKNQCARLGSLQHQARKRMQRVVLAAVGLQPPHHLARLLLDG